jgi:TPR repeat protein
MNPSSTCVNDASVTHEQLEYIRALRESGDSKCKMLLGGLYESGRSVPLDIAKAKTLYQSAADVDE